MAGEPSSEERKATAIATAETRKKALEEKKEVYDRSYVFTKWQHEKVTQPDVNQATDDIAKLKESSLEYAESLSKLRNLQDRKRAQWSVNVFGSKVKKTAIEAAEREVRSILESEKGAKEVARILAEQTAALEALQLELARLNTELEAAKVESSKFKKEVKDLQEAKEIATGREAAQAEEIERLRKLARPEVPNLSGEVAKLKGQLAERERVDREDRESLTVSLEEAEKSLTESKQQVAKLQAVPDQRALVAKLESDLRSAREQLTTAQAEVTAAQKAGEAEDPLGSWVAEIGAKVELTARVKQIAELEAQLASQKEIADNREQNLKLANEDALLAEQSRSRAVFEENRRLKDANAALSGEQDNFVARTMQAEAYQNQSASQVRGLYHENEQLNVQAAEAEEAKEQLEGGLEGNATKYEVAEALYLKAANYGQELLKRVTELRGDLNEANEKLNEANKQLEEKSQATDLSAKDPAARNVDAVVGTLTSGNTQPVVNSEQTQRAVGPTLPQVRGSRSPGDIAPMPL